MFSPAVIRGLIASLSLASCRGEPHWRAGSGEDSFALLREEMVAQQLVARDIVDQKVLRVMGRVPRHLFVPEKLREYAYVDRPLPIGEGQTISQPYIVAYMTQALEVGEKDRVLEVGTGSGYQAAVLAELVEQVYTIEIIPALAEQAERRLEELGYENIRVRQGDGYLGWPEAAPFDAIAVTAAPSHVPQPLVAQLKEGGRLVLPVGGHSQELVRLVKEGGTTRLDTLLPVRFVPMTGKAQERP
jgi:protein-L-isoaspartate(D-aspartate) O-methyltransferase